MSAQVKIENGEITEYQESPYFYGNGAFIWDEGAQAITAVVEMNGERLYMTAKGIYKAP